MALGDPKLKKIGGEHAPRPPPPPPHFQSTYVVVLQKVEKKTSFTQKPCITTKALMTINSECLY